MTDRESSDSTGSSSSSLDVDEEEDTTIDDTALLSGRRASIDEELTATVNHNDNVIDSEVLTTTVGRESEPESNEKLIEEKTSSQSGDKESEQKDEPATNGTMSNIPDYLRSKCGRDWDGEELKKDYIPTPRPKLLATQKPFLKPPPGATFFREVSWHAILEIEDEDPFKKIKLFNLTGSENRPVTLKYVPIEYRPYKGCIFVSLMYSCAYSTASHMTFEGNLLLVTMLAFMH